MLKITPVTITTTYTQSMALSLLRQLIPRLHDEAGSTSWL